jgi:hypothetical protein
MLRRNAACVQTLCSTRQCQMGRGGLICQIDRYTEVIYETQSPFVVHERTCDRGLLEAAVDVAQCSCGLFDHGAGVTAGFEFLELHAERAACRSVEPVDDKPAAGLVQQRHCDAATG